ncbi:MAG: Trm112 family protein [Pseudomonadota bacterium]
MAEPDEHDIGDDEKAVLDERMVDLLVCPLTKQALTYDEAAHEFISKAAKLAYPVRGGVPILLPSEARSLETEGGPTSKKIS